MFKELEAQEQSVDSQGGGTNKGSMAKPTAKGALQEKANPNIQQ